MELFLLLFLAIIIISIIVNFLFFIGQKIAKIINEEIETIKRNL